MTSFRFLKNILIVSLSLPGVGITEGFYIDSELRDKLNSACSKRGDKSKIINQALREYFKPPQTEEFEKLKIKVVSV